jgi:hypothetical protein
MADHAHRYRLEEPSGPTSEGVCSICGHTKAFRNWEPIGAGFEERRIDLGGRRRPLEMGIRDAVGFRRGGRGGWT